MNLDVVTLPDLFAVLNVLNDAALHGVMPFLNGFIFELLACTAAFVFWLDRRPRFTLRVIVSVVCVIAIAVATYIPIVCLRLYERPADGNVGGMSGDIQGIWFVIGRFFLLYVACYALIRICFAVTVKQGVFYIVSAVALQHFVYCATRIVMLSLPDEWGNVEYWPGAIMFLALTALFYGIGCWLFARPLVGRLPETVVGGILMMFVGLLLCVNVFSCWFEALSERDALSGGSYQMMVLTRFVTCAFVLALLAEIVKRERAERDGIVLQQLLNQQKSQLANDKATIDLINIKTHDLKKQLGLLGGRISQEEIDGLNRLVSIYDSSVRTGNETLDVLLANKSLQCEQRGIRFDRMIDGELLDFMKPADIYSLFGNAVDNAIEAVLRLDDDADRYVSMTVCKRKEMLSIHIENPYVGELRFDDGLPQTTKQDKDYHGFGTRSMRMIVDRYDGVLTIGAADHVYTVDVLMPLSEYV
ncbi:ATP-binding protein [Bifidobacterium dentium]|nr:ATP-binding protein [Bifidobacterium dentium]HBJ52138.1 ATP-binding protein [Bifidobacterium dentium]